MKIESNSAFLKVSILFAGILSLAYMLYFIQDILVPVIYATLLSIALSPVVRFFIKLKINRILAITITLSLLVMVTLLGVILIASQASMFIDSFPRLLLNMNRLMLQSENWLVANLNVSQAQLKTWIEAANLEMIRVGKSIIGVTLLNIGGLLVVILLVPVYVFLILFYQPLLIAFIQEIFHSDQSVVVNEVLYATKKVVQRYLVGLVVEAVIVAALNSAGLLFLGVDYAILIGVLGALLNVIPYIGGIIAVAMPMLIALAGNTPLTVLLVVLWYLFVQLIDNNILIPKIMANKVQVNALVSVIVVIAGGAFWGVPGMFLSIPVTAILKVVCDHVEILKPWGKLLGVKMNHPKKQYVDEIKSEPDLILMKSGAVKTK